MKKRTVYLLILIVVLCFLPGCSKQQKAAGEQTLASGTASAEPKSTQNAIQEETQTGAENEVPAVTMDVSQPQDGEPKKKRIIEIGDSRSVCLYCSQVYSEQEYPAHVFYNISEDNYTGIVGDTTFIAKGGEGCAWLQAKGMPLALEHMADDTVIVVWFGVNDPGNAEKYANYVNNIIVPLGSPVYYMSVGPCNGNWASKNADIVNFNAILAQKLDPSVHIISAYEYILEGLGAGYYATMDGLHYDYQTSREIYQYMVDCVTITEMQKEMGIE